MGLIDLGYLLLTSVPQGHSTIQMILRDEPLLK